jgi:hypothetical protein
MTEQATNRWAFRLAFLAAILMFIGGAAQFFAGLAAVLGNVPYAFTTGDQLFDFGLSTWGWIHLLVGLVVAAAGAALLTGQLWARVVAIVLVLLSAVANFLYIPQYPVWALTIIALDVLVIRALTVQYRDAMM